MSAMLTTCRLTACLCLALANPLLAQAAEHDSALLYEGFAHLGDDPTPEWSEAPEQPRAAPLVIRFEAARNADEQVL
ncbi:MAG: hypothetical protein DRQ55_11620, partial [Planctomycetota bacterium]